MKLSDLFEETYSALSANPVRSGLTVLGIVIGISSVIALVGVGQGATSSITSSINALGTNLLVVTPGASRSAGPVSGGFGTAKTLTLADATAVKSQITDASNVAVEISGRYQVTYKSSNTNASVDGTQASYANIRDISMSSGVFISDVNVASSAKVAVIGPTLSTTLFGTGVDPTGQLIRINQIQFQVIGETVSKGSTGITSSDSTIFIPYTTAERFLAGSTATLSDIDIQAKDATSVNTVQQEVTDLLLSRHQISSAASADFSVANQAQLVSSLSTVTSTLTLLLGAIAGISLLVGGIGIMNMMLTTVTERTREIGLRKAIGAKRGDVSQQFLAEAVMLTFIGGLIGIILGWGIATLVTKLGLVTAVVTWQSVALAFGVSALVGIVFGYYPAYRAASLKPIDALKYE